MQDKIKGEILSETFQLCDRNVCALETTNLEMFSRHERSVTYIYKYV